MSSVQPTSLSNERTLRVFRSGARLMVVAGSVVFVGFCLTGMYNNLVPATLVVFCGLVAPYVLERFGRTTAAHLTVSAAVAALVWTIVPEGGLQSPGAMWLVVPSVVAGLLGGQRAAIVWGVLSIAVLVSLGVADPEVVVPPTESIAFQILDRCILVGFTTALVLAYLRHSRWVESELLAEIERRRLAEETAQQAAAAKTSFLANMSHELRTPMNGVVGMSSLLSRTSLSTEQQEFVRTIRNSADTLLVLINDVLDFSKLNARKIELESEPFHLLDAVQDAVEMLAADAGAAGIELAVQASPTLPYAVRGDVTRFRQIVVNLVSNAVKFTPEGEVVVRLTAEDTQDGMANFTLVVEDTGVGIPLEAQAHIFESFAQAESSTTRRFGGTGLGLAIVSYLVEAMEGEITVSSEVGVGTTFSVTWRMPVADEIPAPPYLLATPTLRGKHALIVDDNAVNRVIVERYLQHWGITFSSVESPFEALRLVDSGSAFDLFLLDMQMPAMDGLALTQELIDREIEGAFLLLTSINQQASLLDKARKLGISKVLAKPMRPSMLFNALMGLLPRTPILPPTRPTGPEALRILLAEDHPVNQRVTRLMLTRLGHDVELANDGIEALQAMENREFDVAFLDVQMPRMDGLEALRRLREREGHQPWTISLTAHAMEGDREICLAAGADDYLSKPVRIEDLREALERRERRYTD